MNTVNISICAGMNCYKTQASWLKEFDQILSPALKSFVHVECGTCEHRCTSDCSHAPCVKVNNKVFSRATTAEVKKAIKSFA